MIITTSFIRKLSALCIGCALILPQLISADVLVSTGSQILIVDVVSGDPSVFISAAGSGMYYDTEEEHLYFSGDGNSLKRADRDGSNIVTLIADVGVPVGDIVIDNTNHRIIWTEPSATRIRRADLDGTNIETLITGISLPWGLAIDQESQTIFWTTVGAIEKAKTDGSGYEEIYFDSETFATFYNLTLSGDTIYATDNTNSRIVSVKTDGAESGVVLSDVSMAAGITYDRARELLIFTGASGGATLQTLALDEEEAVELADVQGFDLIAGYTASDEAGEPEEIAEPGEDDLEPSIPAPAVRPPYTRMYVTTTNSSSGIGGLHWISPYLEISSSFYSGSSVDAIGHSKNGNRLFLARKIGPAEHIQAADPSTLSFENVTAFSAALIRYNTILSDEQHKRVYFGERGAVDYCEKDGFGKCWRLQESSTGQFKRGFATSGSDLWWIIGQHAYRMKRNNIYYVPTGSYASQFYVPVRGTGAFDDGMLVIYEWSGKLWLGLFFAQQQYEFLLGDVNLGDATLPYDRVTMQHLDPNTYEIPYAFYLSGGNRIDVLYFAPKPVVIPFYRFSQNTTVTDMAEVPIDGEGNPLFEVGAKQIRGRVTFPSIEDAEAEAEPDRSRISVHLIQLVETESESKKRAAPSQTTYSTETDQNGEYEFNNLPEGSYQIYFERQDLKFSSKLLTASVGAQGPAVLAQAFPLEELDCTETLLTDTPAEADKKANRMAAIALRVGKKGFKNHSKKMKRRVRKASNKLNTQLSTVLEKSRELPTVQIECGESSDCELIDNQQRIQAHITAVRKLKRASVSLIKLGSGESPSAKVAKKLNSLARSAKKAVKGLPESTYLCDTSQATEQRDESVASEVTSE